MSHACRYTVIQPKASNAGMLLAGRVAKGADKGCMACHTVTGGDDREVLLK